jgi:hypothetical protein
MCPVANKGNAYLDSGIFKDIKVPAHTNMNVADHFTLSIVFGDIRNPSHII